MNKSNVQLPVRERLFDLLESAPCGFVSTLEDGTIVYANQTFARWVGQTPEALTQGVAFQDCLTVPTRLFYETHHAPVLQLQGSIHQIACKLKREGREPLPVLLSSVLAKGEGNEPALVRTTLFDASDRLAQEQELRGARNEAQQLAAVVTSSSDAIITVGFDGLIRSWNPAAARIFGFAEAEAVGSPETLIVPEDKYGEQREKHELIRSGQPTVLIDTIRVNKQGERLSVEISASPMKDQLGRVWAMSLIIRDIGERKSAEVALQSSEYFRQQVMDVSPGIIYVIDIPETRCVFINQAVKMSLGFQPPEIIAMGSDLFTKGMHADDQPNFQTHLQVVKQLGAGQSASHEYRMKDKFGEWHWFKSVDTAFKRNAGGVVYQFIGVATEITAQKRNEEALRRSHDYYLNLIQSNPFGVYLVDSDFRLAEASVGAREVFKPLGPVIGTDFVDVLRALWKEPFAGKAEARFRHTLLTGESYRSRDTTEMRAGMAVTESYDWHIQRVTLPDERFGVVCYFYDMTDRVRNEEQIRLLLNEVNHRSKNLLAVVQAVAQHSARDQEPVSYATKLTQRIQSLAANQDLLVRNQWHDIDLGDLAKSQLAPFAGLFNTRIFMAGPEVLLSPSAGQAIGMALHELATNAAKFGALSTETGTVHLTWTVGAEPERLFMISWTEQSGPLVVAPPKLGFGHKVLKQILEASVNGKVDVDYRPSGLFWKLNVAAKNLSTPVN